MAFTVFIIPAADHTDATFTLNGGVFQKNWSENAVAELDILARAIGMVPDARERKADFIHKLQYYVSWQPEEEAFRRWPVLNWQQLEVPVEKINTLYNKIYREVMDDMPPEFLAFGQRSLNFLNKRGEDFARAAMLSKEEADAPPAWYDKLLGDLIEEEGFEAPKEPHILVKVQLEEMDHDGYCSECEEDDGFVAKKIIHFGALPTGTYDFSKKSWKGGVSCSSGSGFCGVRDIYTLLSTEVLE